MPNAKLTLSGDTKRLSPAVFAPFKFLNSFKVNALSAVTFCSSKDVSTRLLPLSVFFKGVTGAFLQEAKPRVKRKSNSGLLRVKVISLNSYLFSPGICLYALGWLNDTSQAKYFHPKPLFSN